MQFLYLLEKIRFPLLDEFMLLITQLGEETAFLAAALIVFWCVDKNRGYYLMAVGFVGTIFNQFLKLLCRVPRPWVLDSQFQPVEGSVEAATGYSFPSGHSQSSVGTFGVLARTSKQKAPRAVFLAICLPSRFFVLGFSVCFLSPLPDSLPQLFLRCFPFAFAFGLSPFSLA